MREEQTVELIGGPADGLFACVGLYTNEIAVITTPQFKTYIYKMNENGKFHYTKKEIGYDAEYVYICS